MKPRRRRKRKHGRNVCTNVDCRRRQCLDSMDDIPQARERQIWSKVNFKGVPKKLDLEVTLTVFIALMIIYILGKIHGWV